MSVEWIHIPAQPSLTLPEQWQARVHMTAAVLRCSRGEGNWDAVLISPNNDTVAALHVDDADLEQAKIEVEHALHQMGWR